MTSPFSGTSPNPNAYDGPSPHSGTLSVGETAKLHVESALRGFIDSSRWDMVLQIILNDPETRGNVLKSVVLNSVSLISIYMADGIIFPLLNKSQQQDWLRHVGLLYQLGWVVPVMALSLYCNSTWSTVLANRIYALQHGRSTTTPSSLDNHGQGITLSRLISLLDASAYRMILIGTSVITTSILGYLPLLGPVLKFLLMSWVNAYYCFEFIWIVRGLNLQERVQIEEERWAYFAGYGLTTAGLCMWGSSLANAALFALLFPGYIIMAMHAQPTPTHPYAPVAPQIDSATGANVNMQPSSHIPVRLPIFAPVIFLNEIVMGVLERLVPAGSITSSGAKKWERGADIEGMEEGGRRVPVKSSSRPSTRYHVRPLGKKYD